MKVSQCLISATDTFEAFSSDSVSDCYSTYSGDQFQLLAVTLFRLHQLSGCPVVFSLPAVPLLLDTGAPGGARRTGGETHGRGDEGGRCGGTIKSDRARFTDRHCTIDNEALLRRVHHETLSNKATQPVM